MPHWRLIRKLTWGFIPEPFVLERLAHYASRAPRGMASAQTGRAEFRIAPREKSMLNTVQFCDERIANSRLLGFLQTLWRPTVEEFREPILKGIELTGNAKKWFDGKHK